MNPTSVVHFSQPARGSQQLYPKLLQFSGRKESVAELVGPTGHGLHSLSTQNRPAAERAKGLGFRNLLCVPLSPPSGLPAHRDPQHRKPGGVACGHSALLAWPSPGSRFAP